MKHGEAREHILDAGMELFHLHGYTATGIEAILKRAGVPKGSFYHHFGSKEQFGIAVIERLARESTELLERFLLDRTRPPLDRISAYLSYVVAHIEDLNCTRGCLLGNLSQEMADQNEVLRTHLARVFDVWLAKFTACLREAQEAHDLSPDFDCRRLAQFFLSGLEGALLQAKVLRSTEPLRGFAEIFLHSLVHE